MNFEKLKVWSRAVALSVDAYRVLAELRDYGFKDQITRSGLSVPSNISEGMVKRSNKERIRFLDIANGSIAEFRTQSYIGIKIGYIPQAVGESWIGEAKEISAMLSALMKKIESD